MGQRNGIFEQMSNPNSPPDPNMSGFSSVVPSRPSSPGGSKHGSSTNLAGAAGAQGENRRSNDLHELFYANYTSLAAKPRRPSSLQRLWSFPEAPRCCSAPIAEDRCHQETEPGLWSITPSWRLRRSCNPCIEENGLTTTSHERSKHEKELYRRKSRVHGTHNASHDPNLQPRPLRQREPVSALRYR